MAIEDENKLTLSRRIASVWVVISMFVAICIGIIGYSASVPMLSTSSQSETIIIQLSGLLGQNGFLLSIIAGIVLAGILASTIVHGRFPAAYSGFRHLPEPASGLLKD